LKHRQGKQDKEEPNINSHTELFTISCKKKCLQRKKLPITQGIPCHNSQRLSPVQKNEDP